MENPWIHLPRTKPYVLPGEAQAIHEYNRSANEFHKIRLNLFPEPFLGDPNAPIVLLNLNPSFDEREIPIHEMPPFAQANLNNLHHELQEYPFYLLNPALSKSLGYRWWGKRLREPIDLVGRKIVSQSILCVEYFPYHSKKYKNTKSILPSQNYGFTLVEGAIKRSALIILMRSERLWYEAVPKLKDYPNLYPLNTFQNPWISHGNCPLGYPRLADILLARQASIK